jgi:hypothetical protein
MASCRRRSIRRSRSAASSRCWSTRRSTRIRRRLRRWSPSATAWGPSRSAAVICRRRSTAASAGARLARSWPRSRSCGQGPPSGGGQRHPSPGLDFRRGGTRSPQSLIVAFIDECRQAGHAVESICRVLSEQGCKIAARTYRAWSCEQQQVAARTLTGAWVMDKVRDLAWTVDGDGELAGVRRLTPEGSTAGGR